MKKIMWLLLCLLSISACNGSDKSKSIVKDSTHKITTSGYKFNPAMPSAQNSDDPNRFSQ